MNLGFSTISWHDGSVKILDQTLLPTKVVYRDIKDVYSMAEAINSLRVRGAPLIGVSAAYGVAIAALNSRAKNYNEFKTDVEMALKVLKSTRPTGYNLFSSLSRMQRILQTCTSSTTRDLFLEEANRIKKEDEDICAQIGKNGLPLIPNNVHILTHCNAGALATCGIGTALALIYLAKVAGKNPEVWVPETRPVLQGSRLTAWELHQAGIPVTLLCDSARGIVIKSKNIDLCIVGADRIARNGDTANKIGTYTLAVLARTHSIPFYVAAPSTTFDTTIETGAQIPIEERDMNELIELGGRQIAPKGVKIFNPAFDVTPAKYITGFITEDGIRTPPFTNFES